MTRYDTMPDGSERLDLHVNGSPFPACTITIRHHPEMIAMKASATFDVTWMTALHDLNADLARRRIESDLRRFCADLAAALDQKDTPSED